MNRNDKYKINKENEYKIKKEIKRNKQMNK